MRPGRQVVGYDSSRGAGTPRSKTETGMIGGYSDHAANERTFLAWVRTGIAVIAFGFVIEKFNIFMLTVASAALGEPAQRAELARLSGRLGRYDGLALIFGGVALVVLATTRFVRTTRLLDDTKMYSASSVRSELLLSAALVLLVASYSIYLAFG
jgi:putative membrane protein